jgi:hypothetical protein
MRTKIPREVIDAYRVIGEFGEQHRIDSVLEHRLAVSGVSPSATRRGTAAGAATDSRKGTSSEGRP